MPYHLTKRTVLLKTLGEKEAYSWTIIAGSAKTFTLIAQNKQVQFSSGKQLLSVNR